STSKCSAVSQACRTRSNCLFLWENFPCYGLEIGILPGSEGTHERISKNPSIQCLLCEPSHAGGLEKLFAKPRALSGPPQILSAKKRFLFGGHQGFQIRIYSGTGHLFSDCFL